MVNKCKNVGKELLWFIIAISIVYSILAGIACCCDYDMDTMVSFSSCYCPNCESKINGRVDFHKQCNNCGYRFFLLKKELKNNISNNESSN